MDAGGWERIAYVFDCVVDLPPHEQTKQLDLLCANEPEIRSEVERLLREHESAGQSFLRPLLEPAEPIKPGDLIAERYEIARLVGRGGMGEVFEAHDRLLDEAIALKTLRPEFARDRLMLLRFQKEIRAARKVVHPNVCRLLDTGVHGGSYYFTMELLAGETLAARIKREGGLSAAVAIPLIRQMAMGLHAAHQAGIIHRDFKSGNVILADERAVVTDFGLARAGMAAAAAAGSGQTTDSIGRAGTLGYMAPEQLGGGRVTAASDIYSLGIVLFEMASGQLPFDENHRVNAAIQRNTGRIPWIRNQVPSIDARWESAIERCLRPEPEKRFRTAAEVAEHFNGLQWPAIRPVKWILSLAAAVVLAVLAAAFWPSEPSKIRPEALPWLEKGVDSVLAMTYESGRRALDKAAALDPDYAPSHAYLALALDELGNQAAVKEELLSALAALRNGRFDSLDSARVEAIERMLARDYGSADRLFSRLVSEARGERERSAALVQLAWLNQRRQNAAGAQKNLEEALRLNASSAGARLRLAVLHSQKQEVEKAVAAFADAERLFQAASDFEGVTEVLLQQSRFLARANRTADALRLAGRGLAIATNTGDTFHQIRLQLVEALAYRNLGQLARSKEAAEAAVKTAVDRKMDGTAAIGLIDLGNAHLLRDEPVMAERYFRQGLEAARSGRADFSEARARASLASLFVQYGRPAEAIPMIEWALTFYNGGGYSRDAMQALLVLGEAQSQLARYTEAESTLREAARRGEQLRDQEHRGLARGFLSGVFKETGRLPEAAIEATEALKLMGAARGGYRAAQVLASRSRILTQLGRFDLARSDVAEARKWAARAAGDQAQVKAWLSLAEAEMAYIQGRWNEAGAAARRSRQISSGKEIMLRAALLENLSALRNGSSAVRSRAAIAALDQGGFLYDAAMGRLLLAEAAQAPSEAGMALSFFEPLQHWEAVWRCRRVMGGLENIAPGKEALDNLRRAWPPDSQAKYFERPDVKKLLPF